MKHSYENISYKWNGSVYKPANNETKCFHNALPTNFQLDPAPSKWEEIFANTLISRDETIPGYPIYFQIKKNIEVTLSQKTNIPEDLIFENFRQDYSRVEELAFLLRFYLLDIKQNEKAGKGPNVTKTITRSEIGLIVGEVIKFLIKDDYPQLLQLVISLLNTDSTQEKVISKELINKKKDKAFDLKVEQPELSIKNIADIIDADRSTVSKWFSADDAQSILQDKIYNTFRIWTYWARNRDLNIEELSSNLGVEATFLRNLKNDKDFELLLKTCDRLEKEMKETLADQSET